MPHTDCLILGFYDCPFPEYVSMLRSMGRYSGAFQDLSLAFAEIGGRPLRALELLTEFRRDPSRPAQSFHNADFLSPAVAYLTTYLKRRGLNADYVNLPHFEMDLLRRKIDAGVLAVAITTTLYVSPQPILALVETLRSLSPGLTIVVGGPYISNQIHTTNREDLCTLFEYLGADIYVTCQEGESTLASLLDALKEGAPLDLIHNLAFRNPQGGFTFTMESRESNALEENIIDYAGFFERPLSEFLSVRTAKSCPFNCAFCGFPERAGSYSYLDVASVEKQLNLIRGLGRISTITFLDDTFNVPKGRFKELLRMMIRNEYEFRWNCFYRADHGDDETIELMGRAGCEGVFLGIESGSDQMLASMNKTARRKHYSHAVPLLRARGISTYASLIVGFPGETDQTVRETIEFIEESAPDYFRAQLWYADPVTPVWKRRAALGIDGVGFDWVHHSMTARRACEWIGRIFLEVENSTWLPQFGFEQWSTFYLARKGMSRAQIKDFVSSFNALIKHRIATGRSVLPPDLLQRAKDSCQPACEPNPRCTVLRRWSGATYRKACTLFAQDAASSKPRVSLNGEGQLRLDCSVECEWASSYSEVLAAYAKVNAERWPEEVLLVQLRSRDLVPISPAHDPGAGLAEWIAHVNARLEAFLPYAHFSTHVYSSNLWREQYGLSGAEFRFGVTCSDGPAPRESRPGFAPRLEWLDASFGPGNRVKLMLHRARGFSFPERAEEKLRAILDLLKRRTSLIEPESAPLELTSGGLVQWD